MSRATNHVTTPSHSQTHTHALQPHHPIDTHTHSLPMTMQHNKCLVLLQVPADGQYLSLCHSCWQQQPSPNTHILDTHMPHDDDESPSTTTNLVYNVSAAHRQPFPAEESCGSTDHISFLLFYVLTAERHSALHQATTCDICLQ